jgi:RimJ/RimL family protein N-acetyltransferase
MAIFDPIHGARIYLRALSNGDAVDLQRIAGNDRVAPMLASVTSPWPMLDVLAWIGRSQFKGPIGFRLGICLHDNSLIGTIGLGGAYPSLMYFMDEKYAGQGYATEAGRLMVAYGFDTYDIEDLTSDVFEDNPASQRVLEKLGFVAFGRAMEHSAARVDEAPVILYRLTRDNFESRQR